MDHSAAKQNQLVLANPKPWSDKARNWHGAKTLWMTCESTSSLSGFIGMRVPLAVASVPVASLMFRGTQRAVPREPPQSRRRSSCCVDCCDSEAHAAAADLLVLTDS